MARRTQHEWFSLRRFASRRCESRQWSGTQPYHRQLRIEPLEDRRLLATFTVVNLNDAGGGSLRQAILDANDSAGADTIAFGSVAGTIALTSGEMEITEALTVNGPGDAALTIDAGGNSRILNISAVTGEFNINGLTLTGGSTTGDNVDYEDTTFNGGAIRSLTTGNLTITNSSVSGNHTAGMYAAGGGVHANGNVTLTNSTVSGNHTARDYAGGGGIFGFGNVTLTSSTVSGNYAAGYVSGGGGVYSNGNVTLTNSTVSGNHTKGDYASGGGISCYGNVTLTNSTVSGNYTERKNGRGGGISAFGEVSLTDSSLTGNHTAGVYARGGGVYADGSVTLINSTVSGNHTAGEGASGGGVYSYGEVTLADSIVSGNHTAGEGADGGGIYAYEGVNLSKSTVIGNRTEAHYSEGGGIFSKGDATLTQSTVSGNQTAGDFTLGGGIYAYGNISLANSTVSGNRTLGLSGDGGGIYGCAHVTLINSTVSGNSTAGEAATGGGIRGRTSVTLTNSTVSGNQTVGDTALGGGIFSYGDVTLTNSTLSGNSTAGVDAWGGGIYVRYSSGSTTLTGSILAGNTAVAGYPDLSPGLEPPSVHFSLIGTNSGTSLSPAPLGSPDGNGNLIGTPGSLIDPLLGPLADNGGPTLPNGSKLLTQAPLPGSPVIDTGDPAIVVDLAEFDQRGAPYLRVHNGDGIGSSRIEMGAIESQPIIAPPALLGDYNHDNVVDAADYTVWRNTLGTDGLAPFSGADGSGNRSVGPEDYGIWKSHFGQTLPPQGAGSGNVAAVVPAEVVAPSVERVASNRVASDQEPSVSDVGRGRLVGTPHFALNRSVVTARQDHALLAWIATATKSKLADESAEPYNPSTRRASESLGDCGLGALDEAFDILNDQSGARRRHE